MHWKQSSVERSFAVHSGDLPGYFMIPEVERKGLATAYSAAYQFS